MPAAITSSDSMFSVRDTPWQGLGAVLDTSPATIAEAIQAPGWTGGSTASQSPSTAAMPRPRMTGEPGCEEIPGYYTTVRQDTRTVLGIVGERYRTVQNEQAFQFVDQLLGSSLHSGRRVWVLATLPEQVEVGGDPCRSVKAPRRDPWPAPHSSNTSNTCHEPRDAICPFVVRRAQRERDRAPRP